MELIFILSGKQRASAEKACDEKFPFVKTVKTYGNECDDLLWETTHQKIAFYARLSLIHLDYFWCILHDYFSIIVETKTSHAFPYFGLYGNFSSS